MTVAAPVTASPPAYTALREVSPSSFTTIPPHRLTSSPSVVDLIKGLGEVPIDIITESTSMVNSLSGITTGRLLPLSSGAPSSILTHIIALTNPFLGSLVSSGLLYPRISIGLQSRRNSISSSSACSTSSRLAGSSSIERR